MKAEQFVKIESFQPIANAAGVPQIGFRRTAEERFPLVP